MGGLLLTGGCRGGNKKTALGGCFWVEVINYRKN